MLVVDCQDCMDALAEWSKAVAQGASPKGRGFKPHKCHFASHITDLVKAGTTKFEFMLCKTWHKSGVVLASFGQAAQRKLQPT